MTDADAVVAELCRRYEDAVGANDADAYAALFAPDAIRMPRGAAPEFGPEQIRASEQADNAAARWSVRAEPLDALAVADGWVYGIARNEVRAVAHADGATSVSRVVTCWLLR